MSDQTKQSPVTLKSFDDMYSSFVKNTIGEYEYDLRSKIGINSMVDLFDNAEDLVACMVSDTIQNFFKGEDVEITKKEMAAMIIAADTTEVLEKLNLANGVFDLDMESFALYTKMKASEEFESLDASKLLSEERENLDKDAILEVAAIATDFEDAKELELDELVNALAPKVADIDVENAPKNYSEFFKATLEAKDQVEYFTGIIKKLDDIEAIYNSFQEEEEEEEEADE